LCRSITGSGADEAAGESGVPSGTDAPISPTTPSRRRSRSSASAPLVLAAVALTGSLSVAGPVRWALRIDPANLLREE